MAWYITVSPFFIGEIMRDADKIEIHQHALEKLIQQRTKAIEKLIHSREPEVTEKYLGILRNICNEELSARTKLKELYGRQK